jgi:hypothetical protein
MILDQISLVDCIVFLVFLTPQLIIHVGLFTTALWVIQALPFLGKLWCTTYAFSLADSLTIALDSSKTSVPIYTRTIFHAEETTNSICPTGDALSGRGHPLCAICICQYACVYWQSLFLETGDLAIPSLSNA